MGISIHLCDPSGDNLELVSSGVYAGNRQFVTLDLPTLSGGTSDRPLWRPVDFAAWRQACRSLPNPEWFVEILTILEDRRDVWVYTSW